MPDPVVDDAVEDLRFVSVVVAASNFLSQVSSKSSKLLVDPFWSISGDFLASGLSRQQHLETIFLTFTCFCSHRINTKNSSSTFRMDNTREGTAKKLDRSMSTQKKRGGQHDVSTVTEHSELHSIGEATTTTGLSSRVLL